MMFLIFFVLLVTSDFSRNSVYSSESQNVTKTRDCVLEENRQVPHIVRRNLPPRGKKRDVETKEQKAEAFKQRQLANMMREEGPGRNVFYNPHYGYEPYWADGDWAISRVTQENACEQLKTDCPTIYAQFGPVCARSKYIEEHRSFTDYCEFQFTQCMKPNEDWMVAYRGLCKPNHVTLSPLYMVILSRAAVYTAEYHEMDLTTWEGDRIYVTFTTPPTDVFGKPIFARQTPRAPVPPPGATRSW